MGAQEVAEGDAVFLRIDLRGIGEYEGVLLESGLTPAIHTYVAEMMSSLLQSCGYTMRDLLDATKEQIDRIPIEESYVHLFGATRGLLILIDKAQDALMSFDTFDRKGMVKDPQLVQLIQISSQLLTISRVGDALL